MIIITSRPDKLKGELMLPGDKSITHRAIILGSLAQGVSEVRGHLDADDCASTIKAMKALGARITLRDKRLLIQGRNMKLSAPSSPLEAGNSGTTARLLLGVLAGQPFTASLTGDSSLSRRPMKRVIEPLSQMGAVFQDSNATTLPLTIKGGPIKAINYKTAQASAQVKSAILLAGLYCEGETTVEEPHLSRNHTELMLQQFGAQVISSANRAGVSGGKPLRAQKIRVPGDISAAAFFMVAAAIIPESELLLKDVGINPTRSGIIDLLRQMGADLELQNVRNWGREKVADIAVRGGAPLKGISVGGAQIPRVIDEIPVLAVAAVCAAGKTVISDASELRVKESDRISALSAQLRRLGAQISESADGMVIEGGVDLKGAVTDSCGDHRLAMAMAVAGFAATGDTVIRNAEVVKISYPGFMQSLRSLIE